MVGQLHLANYIIMDYSQVTFHPKILLKLEPHESEQHQYIHASTFKATWLIMNHSLVTIFSQNLPH